MRLLAVSFFCLMILHGLTQKPVIDFDAIDSWSTVSNKAQISDDGRFVVYSIDSSAQFTLIVQSTDGKWRKELGEGQIFPSKFSKDGRFYFYNMNKGGLHILNTANGEIEEMASVKSWVVAANKKREYLILLLDINGASKLLIRDLLTGKQHEIDSVNQFHAAANGNMVLTKEGQDCIYKYHLTTGRISLLARAFKADNFVFDQSGNQVAFIGVDTALTKGGFPVKSIWCCDLVSGKKQSLISDSSCFLKENFFIQSITGFCADDSSVSVDIMEHFPVVLEKPTGNNVEVCIWSYRDSLPQIFKNFSVLPKRQDNRIIKGVYLLTNHRFVKLESGDTVAVIQPGGKYWVVTTASSNRQDAYWNPYVTSSKLLGLVSAKDGSLVNLLEKNIGDFYTINQYGNCIVFFDTIRKEYFSYNMISKKTINLTEAADLKGSNWNVIGWLNGGKQMVVNFRDDLWLLDVTGAKAARNITNGYWKGQDINFCLLKKNGNELLKLGGEYYVAVFNKRTKRNEICIITLKENSTPRLVYSADVILYTPGAALQSGKDFVPIKAADAEVYLVKKMRANASGNYFATRDFKKFEQLSYVYPEKRYNWISSELINCKLPDSSIVQGVLYKPENFDTGKKYPVIIHYYETKSDELNLFLVPDRIGAAFNIPWFVSRGYLVLCIDIHYETGRPGVSAFKSINAGADYLSSLPYVKKDKMGLFGHSFGGFETNYIVTHTTRFAAAVSSAGVSNMIANYTGLWGNGLSKMNFVAYGQTRMGTSPWENPDAYIDNSPVFLANEVETPLLLLHNIKDVTVPFEQGVAFFTALRRNGKKAWLLQYDNANHLLTTKQQEADFTNRVTDYFNYFLKDMHLPCWMMSSDAAQFKRDCVGYNN